jgi:hypothetical protein
MQCFIMLQIWCHINILLAILALIRYNLSVRANVIFADENKGGVGMVRAANHAYPPSRRVGCPQ